jgi:predicted DNA-binding antitoxin AbrB/MazE fold protein
MTTAVDAIYEDGLLRPLHPLPLPEHTRVRLSVETVTDDPERAEWLAQSERRLREVWENDADDVFNELLPQ